MIDHSITIDHPFHNIQWYRLFCTLLNIRSANVNAHPFSIFQAIIKAVSQSVFPDNEQIIFFHIKNKKYTSAIRESDKIHIEIFFCKMEFESVSRWKEAFINYLAHPDTGKNFDIVECGNVEERNFDSLLNDAGEINSEGELCLEFLTPLPFKLEKDQYRTFLNKSSFIRAYENRFTKLFGKEISYNPNLDNFVILPYYWKYTEIRHPSKSQPGEVQLINGCVGNLYIKGSFKNFLPFIMLGSELHTGTKISNSQGYYFLHKNSLPYFSKYFPDKRTLLSVIRNVIEKYDNALRSISDEKNFPFSEEKYSESLYVKILENTYIHSPNTAFVIKKKDKTDRTVEHPDFNDLIVEQYILKTITDVFDRIFEKEAIGFRKGMSRQKAVEMVEEAIREGYLYVVESDIEDFFPSVDIDKLIALINLYIPQNDFVLKNILFKCIKSGFVLNGVYYERIKGLAEGSPLSPILANLYLDSFDEKIKELGVKIIRYADDFIILTKTEAEAENILSETESYLSELGLKLKKEKTAIKQIKDGFQFLGIEFGNNEIVIKPDDVLKQLKKPLYITEPYVFMSLNGEAIDILKNRELISTIPIRRIEEIIVMEKAVFSTALIAKCAENNIPFTIVLNSGYFVATIKPDSKKYYNISYEHTKKYSRLSDTEIICIAKEFAAHKIKNYISLFKQKYIKEQNVFIKELEEVVNKIYEAGDVNAVRGYEGFAAKNIYQKLNLLMDDKDFHIKKRTRINPDRINSLLNFGYYLLFSRINTSVRASGLNPYLGFLHSPQDDYESFVCDIEELFRARMDRFIIKLINLKIITKDDFLETDRGMYLKKEKVKIFLNQLEREWDAKSSDGKLSLGDNLFIQISIVKKWILENISLSFYTWEV